MDGCVLLTSTPSCVVLPRGETTHSGVDVNNTHPSMINPLIRPRYNGTWLYKGKIGLLCNTVPQPSQEGSVVLATDHQSDVSWIVSHNNMVSLYHDVKHRKK